MQTIFIWVKCELGQTYSVAADAVENVEQVSKSIPSRVNGIC